MYEHLGYIQLGQDLRTLDTRDLLFMLCNINHIRKQIECGPEGNRVSDKGLIGMYRQMKTYYLNHDKTLLSIRSITARILRKCLFISMTMGKNIPDVKPLIAGQGTHPCIVACDDDHHSQSEESLDGSQQ